MIRRRSKTRRDGRRLNVPFGPILLLVLVITLIEVVHVLTVEESVYAQDAAAMDIAAAVGQPQAVRAVGTANGKNPVALLVPCHRVIRSDGSLGGYAGGLDRKRKLLAAEGADPLLI